MNCVMTYPLDIRTVNIRDELLELSGRVQRQSCWTGFSWAAKSSILGFVVFRFCFDIGTWCK